MKINLRELELYLKALGDVDRAVRCRALRDLANFSAGEWQNTPEAVSQAIGAIVTTGLLRNSEGGDAAARTAAAKALGNIGSCSPSVVPQLLLLLKDEDGAVQIEAVRSLHKIGEAAGAASVALAAMLRDNGDDQLRGEAARALARVAPSSVAATAALRGALGDQSGRVCVSAAEALWNISRTVDNVLPTLVQRLTDPRARDQAIQVLYRIGPDAKDAVPALLAVAADENRLFRESVILALRKIEPKAAASVRTD
jgi:HEAT repeat protein